MCVKKWFPFKEHFLVQQQRPNQNPAKHLWCSFSCKMFHQISLIRFYIRIYYHWDDSYFKSSYLEVFCKIVVRKNSVKFTGKHLRWRRLSGTVTGYGKRKPSLYFFPWILRPFQTSIVVHLSSTVSAVWYAAILLSQSFFWPKQLHMCQRLFFNKAAGF